MQAMFVLHNKTRGPWTGCIQDLNNWILANPGIVWGNGYQPLDIVMNTDVEVLGKGRCSKSKKLFLSLLCIEVGAHCDSKCGMLFKMV